MNSNSVTSLLPSYLLPFNSTANTASANSASSVQQQADVLSLPPSDQFLAQLQQVQTPQQFQAMISQMTGQPPQADTTASNSAATSATTGAASGATPPAGHHCRGGGHHASSSSQSSDQNPFLAASTPSTQNQSLIASIFGSVSPSQSAVL
ncbi:MAG: hypothetical protein WBE37_28890 [Bryobacteraceae bacterium]